MTRLDLCVRDIRLLVPCQVWRSQSGPLGPYRYQGYLNPPLPNPPNSTYTPYTIPAQQFGVHPITLADGRMQPLYIGLRWGSAPDGLKNHDFQYWQPIHQAEGALLPLTFVDSFELPL